MPATRPAAPATIADRVPACVAAFVVAAPAWVAAWVASAPACTAACTAWAVSNGVQPLNNVELRHIHYVLFSIWLSLMGGPAQGLLRLQQRFVLVHR